MSLKNAFERNDVKDAVLDDYCYKLNIETGIHSTGFCFVQYLISHKGDGRHRNLGCPTDLYNLPF